MYSAKKAINTASMKPTTPARATLSFVFDLIGDVEASWLTDYFNVFDVAFLNI